MITLASENHGFYDTFGFGDIVQVTPAPAQLASDDGYGDWNVGDLTDLLPVVAD